MKNFNYMEEAAKCLLFNVWLDNFQIDLEIKKTVNAVFHYLKLDTPFYDMEDNEEVFYKKDKDGKPYVGYKGFSYSFCTESPTDRVTVNYSEAVIRFLRYLGFFIVSERYEKCVKNIYKVYSFAYKPSEISL